MVCPFKFREAEQTLIDSAIKEGFTLAGALLFKLLSAQAKFERWYQGKRPSEPKPNANLEEVSNRETEGTTRKISKSESAISTLTVIDDESSEEESNLSITHLSDQTTVIKTKQETSLERHIRESREYLLSKEYFEYCCETSRYYSANLNDYGT